MPDPAMTVAGQIRYEIRIVSGPLSFDFRSQAITIDSGEDLVVLARITTMGRTVLEQAIVGIIGSKSRLDTAEFLALRSFLAAGGVIGLNKDLL